MTSFFDIQSTLPWPNAIGKRTAIGPVCGAAQSHFVAELAKTTPLILVITENTASAHTLAAELPFYGRSPGDHPASGLGNPPLR